MKMRSLVWIAAAVAMVGMARAEPVTISYSATNALRDATWEAGAAGTDLVVPQLSPSVIPSGYYLSAIQVIITGTIQADYRIENISEDETHSYSYWQYAKIDVFGPGGSLTLETEPMVSAENKHLTIFDGLLDYGGTSGQSHIDKTSTRSATNAVGSSHWNLYTGDGDVTFATAGFGRTLEDSSGGNATVLKNIRAGSELTINYVLIPEPMTMGISAITLAALITIRRMRRKRAALAEPCGA